MYQLEKILGTQTQLTKSNSFSLFRKVTKKLHQVKRFLTQMMKSKFLIYYYYN